VPRSRDPMLSPKSKQPITGSSRTERPARRRATTLRPPASRGEPEPDERPYLITARGNDLGGPGHRRARAARPTGEAANTARVKGHTMPRSRRSDAPADVGTLTISGLSWTGMISPAVAQRPCVPPASRGEPERPTNARIRSEFELLILADPATRRARTARPCRKARKERRLAGRWTRRGPLPEGNGHRRPLRNGLCRRRRTTSSGGLRTTMSGRTGRSPPRVLGD
jgi:hypothetical protein